MGLLLSRFGRERIVGVTFVKPLRSAPLTDEDTAIWIRVCVANGGHAAFTGCHEFRAVCADRGDAELMLTLTRARRDLKTLNKGVQEMYGLLTPRERKVLERLFGRRGQE
jgi:hypothetical protein